MASEDKSLNMTAAELTEQLDWWRDIIIHRDGNVSLEHVLQELHDYRFLIDQASEVYYTITCGTLSKTCYYAKDVISVYERCSEDAAREIIAETLDRLDAGETTDDIRKDFEL